ncbi:MAG TPA: hypothetical protein DEA73_06775 [Peptococcaceae bacterium]|nr:hypothetical protein [Peptococcaceae bacterium]
MSRLTPPFCRETHGLEACRNPSAKIGRQAGPGIIRRPAVAGAHRRNAGAGGCMALNFDGERRFPS